MLIFWRWLASLRNSPGRSESRRDCPCGSRTQVISSPFWLIAVLIAFLAACWHRRIPATMWTDTSEFRNPLYHQPGDRPETLNYPFLRSVSQLLVASVLSS